MKVEKYLRGALAAVVGIAGIAGWLTPASAGDIGSKYAAALSHINRTVATDPILIGNGSTLVAPGTTNGFFAMTGEYIVAGCKTVAIQHADGSVYDNSGSGKLFVHGADVAVIFFDKYENPLSQYGSELATGAPNGPLYAAGYAVTSPQEVDFRLSDFSPAVGAVAVIIEGDVTNTDTKPHTATSAVNAVINVLCFS